MLFAVPSFHCTLYLMAFLFDSQVFGPTSFDEFAFGCFVIFCVSGFITFLCATTSKYKNCISDIALNWAEDLWSDYTKDRSKNIKSKVITSILIYLGGASLIGIVIAWEGGKFISGIAGGIAAFFPLAAIIIPYVIINSMNLDLKEYRNEVWSEKDGTPYRYKKKKY